LSKEHIVELARLRDFLYLDRPSPAPIVSLPGRRLRWRNRFEAFRSTRLKKKSPLA
jgi:hypothetical protein